MQTVEKRWKQNPCRCYTVEIKALAPQVKNKKCINVHKKLRNEGKICKRQVLIGKVDSTRYQLCGGGVLLKVYIFTQGAQTLDPKCTN